MKMVSIVLVGLLCLGLYSGRGYATSAMDEALRERVRVRVESAEEAGVLQVGGEFIFASVTLPQFYRQRLFAPAWSHEGAISGDFVVLVERIRAAAEEGLNPADYHLALLERFSQGAPPIGPGSSEHVMGRLIDLDLAATDAFLILASHLLKGKVDPVTVDAEWHARRRGADLAGLLETALDENKLGLTLDELLPPQPEYRLLRETLRNYRRIEEGIGWLAVPAGPIMKKGGKDVRVAGVRVRLAQTGDVPATPQGGMDALTFDEELELGVKAFQARHGLDVDGIVGPETLRELNVPPGDRVRQIRANLERWRWLPQDLGRRNVLVNIANFELEVIEDGKRVLVSRAVVGRPYRRTPVFSAQMTYVVINPSWNVPPTIATKDILPEAKKDPGYLVRKNFKVFAGWGGDLRELDPLTVAWERFAPNDLPVHFLQPPGPSNALGRIKFMFPNEFDVYIHDTPARELFEKSSRGFSSGCIRIEKSLELAEYVLAGSGQWRRDKVLDAIGTEQELTVRLPRPIPVHVLYWTAWVDGEGVLQFRRDIYNRDALLIEALDGEAPRPEPPLAGGSVLGP